jgi:RNA polymerase sigma-70 factor, ECF subfamily
LAIETVFTVDSSGVEVPKMTRTKSKSQHWVQEVMAGENEAVEEFWLRYGQNLQRLAGSRMSAALQRRLGPEDVVQSVCRTFVRRARVGEFHLHDTEELWRLLCAITLTKVRQHARFHYRKRRSLLQEQIPSGAGACRRTGTIIDQFPDDAPTPDEGLAIAEQMQILFDELTEEESTLIRLKLEGVRQDDIAICLGCSKRTVGRLLLGVRTRWSAPLQVPLTIRRHGRPRSAATIGARVLRTEAEFLKKSDSETLSLRSIPRQLPGIHAGQRKRPLLTSTGAGG